MTKFIAIISTKGGVGKTTVAMNLTSALTWLGRDVLVMDANFANPDIGMHLGAVSFDKTLHSALDGKHHIRESIYRHPTGLKIIPGSISYNDAKYVRKEKLIDIILDLAGTSEAVIIDTTPGLGEEARSVVKVSDYVLIVTTPNITSVSNSLKVIQMAEEFGKEVLGVIINRQRDEPYEMTPANVAMFLEKKVIGVIPEDVHIRHALHYKKNLISHHPNCPASNSFKTLAASLIGQKYEAQLEKEEERSLFYYVLRNLGLRK